MTFQHLGNTLKKVLHIGIEVATDGQQKLSHLAASLLPRAQAWAQKNSINWPAEEIQKWASAVVDTINLFPAPPTAAPPAQ